MPNLKKKKLSLCLRLEGHVTPGGIVAILLPCGDQEEDNVKRGKAKQWESDISKLPLWLFLSSSDA